MSKKKSTHTRLLLIFSACFLLFLTVAYLSTFRQALFQEKKSHLVLENDLENLSGNWKLISLVVNSEVITPVKEAEPVLSFTSNHSGVFKLDCSKSVSFKIDDENTELLMFNSGADTTTEICNSKQSMLLASQYFHPALGGNASYSIKNERLLLDFPEKNTLFIFSKL